MGGDGWLVVAAGVFGVDCGQLHRDSLGSWCRWLQNLSLAIPISRYWIASKMPGEVLVPKCLGGIWCRDGRQARQPQLWGGLLWGLVATMTVITKLADHPLM